MQELRDALAAAQRQEEAVRQHLNEEQAARGAACNEAEALRVRIRQLEQEAKLREERAVVLAREAQETALRADQAARQSAAIEKALRSELDELRRTGADSESQRTAQNAELRALNLGLQQAALSLEAELESSQLELTGLTQQVKQLSARCEQAAVERDALAQQLGAEKEAHDATREVMGQELIDLKVIGKK